MVISGNRTSPWRVSEKPPAKEEPNYYFYYSIMREGNLDRGSGRGREETIRVPGDVSMLRRVLETMAAFLSTTNSKPSALMSLTKPVVSSSSSLSSRGRGAAAAGSPLPTMTSICGRIGWWREAAEGGKGVGRDRAGGMDWNGGDDAEEDDRWMG